MYKKTEAVLRKKFSPHRIAIIGFGKEGQSTYRLLRKLLPEHELVVADRNEDSMAFFRQNPDTNLRIYSGDNYLDAVAQCSLLMKSPGVKIDRQYDAELSSQTRVFMELFRDRIIGVTGTKGKSTTSTLIYHLLKTSGRQAHITGNIGVPSFDIIKLISEESLIVYELSAHQLQDLTVSPHIAVLLNIYQEHLDFFDCFEAYSVAKYRIALNQQKNDSFIFSEDIRLPDTIIARKNLVSHYNYSLKNSDAWCHIADRVIEWGSRYRLSIDHDRKLMGDHNLLNIMAAVSAVLCAGCTGVKLAEGISGFAGLPHRLEYLGEFNGIRYYNDSIATIPESCIQAVETLGTVDTLILGGYDRGIDYDELIRYLVKSTVGLLLFVGPAGKRMADLVTQYKTTKPDVVLFEDFDSVIHYAKMNTARGGVCLLSPAASSYDEFRNFEHRGDRFRELITA